MKNILIAEDDPKILEMLKLFVSSKNHNPILCRDGQEAIDFVLKNPKTEINLLISDFEMPRVKGDALVKYFNENNYKFPKIFLTSHSDKNILIGSINQQIYKFIEKPFNYKDLEEHYSTALDLNQSITKSDELKRLGESYSIIVHEINNPINNIIAFSELIKLSVENKIELDYEKLSKQLDSIQQAGMKIHGIVQDVKEFINAKPVMVKNFKIDQVFAEIKSNYAVIKNHQKVQLLLPEQIEDELKMDKNQLYRILINLISNSVDAVSDLPERWVKIEYLRTKTEAHIRVIDSGKGISSEIAEQMFNIYFSQKKSIKGTGLGLDICRKILKSYDGNLEYNLFNNHTSFLIRIPQ